MSATNLGPPARILGVRRAMNDAAKKVVDNVMSAALSRLMVLFGVPAILAGCFWLTGTLVAVQQITAIQAAEQARLVSEVRELQEYRRDAYARGSRMQQELTTIREDVMQIQNNLDQRR